MKTDNPYNIQAGQELAVLSSGIGSTGKRRGILLVKVTRVSRTRFNVEGGNIYRLSDLRGHGHPGIISNDPEHIAQAHEQLRRRNEEAKASAKIMEERKRHPGYDLACRLNWSSLSDHEIIERWLRLDREQLLRIINELEQAGVDL